MPSIHQILSNQLVVGLKALLAAANIEHDDNCRRKAPLIDLLIANPAAIPADMRRQAVPPVLLPEEVNAQERNNGGNNDDLVAQMREMISAALVENFAPLAARIAALENRPGEPQIPPPSTTPAAAGPANLAALLGTSVALPANPRVFFDNLDDDVYLSVVNNTFSIRDLWKLDPRRQGELLGSTHTALQSLASALNSTEDAKTALAKGKYRSLGEILRPWLVYSQLRETITPGILFYLVGYAIELVRIDAQYPDAFAHLLDYHLRVCKKRMNVGSALDPNEWCRTDNPLFFEVYMPLSFAQPPAASSSRNNEKQQQQQTAPAPSWSVWSVGLGTREYPCDKWNAAKPCASTPCPFQHVCKTCKTAGHTAMRCSKEGRSG